jgi:hypothetical protein
VSAWGFGEVPETSVRIDVGYSTAVFDRRPGELHGATGAIIAGTVPESTRFSAVFGVEGDRWIITLVGALADYPPTELAAWREFARSLPTPETYDLVKDREPLGPIDCLSRGDDQLAKRFFERLTPILASPWAIATGEDYPYPQVQGQRPPGFRLISRYMERAHRVAASDPVVLRRFFDVASLLAPPTAMMAPQIAWRVLFGPRISGQGSPVRRGKFDAVQPA